MMEDDTKENYRELLDKNRVEIVQSLDLDRQYVFSHLRSKFVLDDEDCQIILNAGPSRQQKSQKFIDVLGTKGPDAFAHFVDALEIEHPHLYEVFTGKKPVGQRFNQAPSQVVPWAVLNDKQLLDFDREYLVKELSKLSDTNQTMAYMHSKLIKEKNILERKNDDISIELDERDVLIKELQTEIDLKHEYSSNAIDNSEQLQEYIHHCQELMRDNVEKSNIIIMLQSRLLAATEQVDNDNKQNEGLRRKNENLMQQVRDLTINYDWQRTQSKRLSEQVDQNNDVIRIAADTKKDIYQLKVQLNHVTEERDTAIQRLDEFKTVMAALNARHDMLQQEKSNEEEQKEQVSEGYQLLMEQIRKLQNELNEEKNRSDALIRRSQRYQQEIEAHKEQREFYLTEREHAIRDRDQVTKERDDALRFNSELQKSRDEAVRKQIEISSQFEIRYTDVSSELERCREALEELHLNQTVQASVPEVHVSSSYEITKTMISKEMNKINEEEKLADETQIDDIDLQRKWRDRTKTEVLQSAYKKLKGDRNKPRAPPNLKYSEMAYVYQSLKGERSPVSDAFGITGPMFFQNKLIVDVQNRDMTIKDKPIHRQHVIKKASKNPTVRHQAHTIQNVYNRTGAENISDDNTAHRKLSRQDAQTLDPLSRSMSFLPNDLVSNLIESGRNRLDTQSHRERAYAFELKPIKSTISPAFISGAKNRRPRRRASEPTNAYQDLKL